MRHPSNKGIEQTAQGRMWKRGCGPLLMPNTLGGMLSRNRASIRTAMWIAGVAAGWLLIGGFITDLGFYATDWLPTSQGLVDWGTIASYAAGGVVAFLAFAALRRWAGAPKLVWAGMAAIEGLPVLMFLVAVLALSLGDVPHALYPYLIAKSDAGALPVAEQMLGFVTWWVWSSVFLVLGAWSGCQIAPAPRESSAVASSA